jgi:acetyl-CoA carboxylase carboxyl transferase subunit beta
LNVCPKCGHHNRLTARERIDLTLDPEGQFEIGAEVEAIDFLKFVDSKRYTERLEQAKAETGKTMRWWSCRGRSRMFPLMIAAFEFRFLGGSMGSVVGERFVRGVQSCCEQNLPFVCFTASGGARMQEGLMSHDADVKDHCRANAAGARPPSFHFGARPIRPWAASRQVSLFSVTW